MRLSPDAMKSYGAPAESSSWISGTRSSRLSALRLPTSKDCTNTLAERWFSPFLVSVRTSAGSSGSLIVRK